MLLVYLQQCHSTMLKLKIGQMSSQNIVSKQAKLRIVTQTLLIKRLYQTHIFFLEPQFSMLTQIVVWNHIPNKSEIMDHNQTQITKEEEEGEEERERCDFCKEDIKRK